MRRTAFTLIEVLAVIALMALLTAAAAVSLSGVARTARVEDAADAFASFDRSTRELARRFERTPALRFDLNRGAVERFDGDGQPVSPWLLGTARVTRVIAGQEDRTSGQLTVPFSTLGRSPSYAVLLSGSDGERWVAFAGLTGQSLASNDEREVQDIFAPPPPIPTRPDAR
jgi:prepilin-type N-terminal cleavage/methylation domain-containing protein